MNIEQIKAQVAEWERSDKERDAQGEWELGGCSGRALTTSNFKYYGDGLFADVDTKANANFIVQAPAMFQAIKQLMARVEELELEKQKEAAENDIYLNGSHCSCYGLSEGSYNGNTTTQWQPEEVSKEALIKRGKWNDDYDRK